MWKKFADDWTSVECVVSEKWLPGKCFRVWKQCEGWEVGKKCCESVVMMCECDLQSLF